MARILYSRVQESTTTTGTGALTLSGAVSGFRAFADVCNIGDTFPYLIETIAQGVPNGAWELGVGTYSALNTLTRTTVHESSNAGAAVDFASGPKRVSMQLHSDGRKNLDLGSDVIFSSGHGVTFRNSGGSADNAGIYNAGDGSVEANVTASFSVSPWGGGSAMLDVSSSAATLTVPISAPNLSGSNTGDQDLSGLATVEALGTGLAGRENAITPGTVNQYWRGDKTWQEFPAERLIAVVASTAAFGAAPPPAESTADTTALTADDTTPVEGAPSGLRSPFIDINADIAEEFARRGL